MTAFFLLFTMATAIVLPVILAIALRRRVRIPWLFFVAGVLTFLGAQAVHLPLNALLARLGLLPELPAEGSRLVQAAVVLGMTAGLTEELARAAAYRLLPRARDRASAVILGLGHGGVEAMIFGGVLVAAGASALWALQQAGGSVPGASPDGIAALELQLAALRDQPLLGIAPLVERLLALGVQVGLSMLVLESFVRRSWLYIAAAVLYHAILDAVLVIVASRTENAWLVLALLALLALPLLAWAWRRVRPLWQGPAEPRAPLSGELRLFGRQVAKELSFQWRSRRALIAGAVFLVFGMLSPLTAKFLPQILTSIEGAEEFAALIPEPTIADAMGQYMENLTQFGLIAVVLLGMGAVAGEKERGTAPMILSKPLPRWAFLLAKFVAQAAVYVIAAALGALAAYVYTLVLFEQPGIGAFLGANGLLLMWLLVFVALTVLASTLARGTGPAAGLAALGVVIVLLGGAVPQLAELAPGALIGWAGRLALQTGGPPAGGALALSLVLIILLLVAAVAAFEEQEL